jgi:CYTH domain-containing protein
MVNKLRQKEEIELELTFLAREIPKEIEKYTPKRIIDIYIPEKAAHAHVRLRQKDDKYEITKKMPIVEHDASSQIETTISLTKEEFEALSGLSNKRIVKDRYNLWVDGYFAEVDVFRDSLAGLVLIDFEFRNEDEKRSFLMPKIALADVTQEEFVAGGFLAGLSYTDIISNLERFNYKKL